MELMEKPFDKEITRLSLNQLLVLKYFLVNEGRVVVTSEIAKKTGVVEKKLGGVLSAMSRKQLDGLAIIEQMGRSAAGEGRWKLCSKAITSVLALAKVKMLISSYK